MIEFSAFKPELANADLSTNEQLSSQLKLGPAELDRTYID